MTGIMTAIIFYLLGSFFESISEIKRENNMK